MKLNTDATRRVVVDTNALDWQASSLPGVWRRMLERDGEEVARATSVVRYDPGSAIDAHEHGGGEEFLVLKGTFTDETGDYPAGSYLRNPVGSTYAPSSAEGCEVLVKLRQMDRADQDVVRVDIHDPALEWVDGGPGTVARAELHAFDGVRTYLARLAPGVNGVEHDHPGGEEVFVLEGEIEDDDGAYPAGTWFRLPDGSRHQPRSPKGALLYVKVGHLMADAFKI